MLETYFVKPETVDRVRACWIGPEIEAYVAWLSEHGYRPKSIWRRVPLLVSFAGFAQAAGARTVQDLPDHVDGFVAERAANRQRRRGTPDRDATKEFRGPVEQMLGVALADYDGAGRRRREEPFGHAAPGFFEYLVDERGLRPDSINGYRHHLDRFEDYLARIGVQDLAELSPAILSAFVAERSGMGLARSTVRGTCGALRVFLRFCHREGVVARDLSRAVDWPQVYRLSTVPRSITWAEVQRVLDSVDRRTPVGKRDYAILLLLVTYGLRGREVAALTLDDIDWRHDRLAVPGRKAGHSTAFPLASSVGEALLDYLQHGRPECDERQVFIRAVAPVRPIRAAAVSGLAGRCLRRAGVEVPRPGSHTLRHSAVQRLVDAQFPLKTIGDFVGHRSPRSTEVYAKVDVETLRQVAMGDGEQVLR
jgi:integrase/recombinase XerD